MSPLFYALIYVLTLQFASAIYDDDLLGGGGDMYKHKPYLGGILGGGGDMYKHKYYGGGSILGGSPLYEKKSYYGGGGYGNYDSILGLGDDFGRDKWSSPIVSRPPPIIIVRLPPPVVLPPIIVGAPPISWAPPLTGPPPSWAAPPVLAAPRPNYWSAPLGAPPVSLCLIQCQGGLTAPGPAFHYPSGGLGAGNGGSWSGGLGGNLGAPTGPLCAVPCTPIGQT